MSKKSFDLRCPSRCSLRVSMLAAWMTTRADDLAESPPSRVALPSKSSKDPRTLVTIA